MSHEVMEPPTEEVLERVRGEFGLNEMRVREAVQHLKDWIQRQPHLPKEIGESDKETLHSTTHVQSDKDTLHSTTHVQSDKDTLHSATHVQSDKDTLHSVTPVIK